MSILWEHGPERHGPTCAGGDGARPVGPIFGLHVIGDLLQASCH